MRSLIDMAAERGAFIDQSQSLNLFMESPNIGQLSSMYMYAWKKGLKTTYYLRSRPRRRSPRRTRAASAARSRSLQRDYTDERVVLLAGESRRCLRGLPVTRFAILDRSMSPRTRCSTPASTSPCGRCATRSFYEMYRDAIKNTWTVEEVDFSIDLNDLRTSA